MAEKGCILYKLDKIFILEASSEVGFDRSLFDDFERSHFERSLQSGKPYTERVGCMFHWASSEADDFS